MFKNVILDAGHGGIDPATGLYVTPGKRSPQWADGSVYYEGIGNRSIAELAARIMARKGIRVFYTVEPNNWRDVSLTKRCQIANQIHRAHRDAVLISIHSNGHKNRSANGFEVFTSPGQTKSDPIATKWFEKHGETFPQLKGRKGLRDGDPDKEAKFTMLTGTTCPAILIESMFHTNYKECKILQSTDGVRDVALAIARTCYE